MDHEILVSVIIPTYNGATRISRCIEALRNQTSQHSLEIIVVNDGSTDDTAEIMRERYPDVRLITQENAGPASARNRGASEAKGSIILFTDDDCEPAPGWLNAMLEPFRNPEVVGTKGAYRTQQPQIIARFVQAEYEDKYRVMSHHENIDFIDTYSAAFRRDKFLEMNGYDTQFPVACAEDIELSYRMSARGWKMRFVPEAVVYHQHPNSFEGYLKKKFKFAFWRMLALKKNPEKAVKDTHTPQLMKLQLLFCPALIGAIAFDLLVRPRTSVSMYVLALFLLFTLPFTVRTILKDAVVGIVSPAVLAARSGAQILGVLCGVVGARRRRL